MLRFISIFLFIIISSQLSAQIGFRANYNMNMAPGWNAFFTDLTGRDTKVFARSPSMVVDYWLRLPNYRVEFFPGVSFHQSTSTIQENFNQGQPDNSFDVNFRQIGAGVIAHFYVLDFTGDCDCPTFSKKGGFFKKGFFLMAGAGGDYSQKSVAPSGYSDGNFDIKLSVGLGLDIGVSDLITVSPFIQYQHYPNISWHELGLQFGAADGNIESSFRQLQLGLRIGLRPDYN